MWPFKDKTEVKPVISTTMDIPKVEPVVNPVVAAMNEAVTEAVAAHADVLNQAVVEEQMIAYIKSKGFDVTPSGTPTGVISKATTAVKDTAVDSYHVVRGVRRKITNGISNKLNELKTLGS